MSELILPGVFIEVRDEGLIVPGGVTVGNLGVVGTASKGPIGRPVILGSATEARERFGEPDPWIDGVNDELTLVRALELAFQHGATTAFAVRVAGDSVKSADYTLSSPGGDNVVLTAKSAGSWANALEINVSAAEENAFVEDEVHVGAGAIVLPNAVASARNRVRLFRDAEGVTRSLPIVYAAPTSGHVQIDLTTGALVFFTGEEPTASDTTTVSYAVDSGHAVKVTLRLGTAKEVYTVVSGNDLAADVNKSSAWVDATPAANAAELPDLSAGPDEFAAFGTGPNTRGDDGASNAEYQDGLDELLNQPAHLIVAAGQTDAFGPQLAAHCDVASTDDIQRERIALVGSGLGATVDDLRGHSLASDRLIFVAPGIRATDGAASPPAEVTLSAAYTAAALAGRLAALSAHVSLTNKVLNVNGLEEVFTQPELKQLVLSRVLALESRDGIRVVKGITTSTNTAFHQITTRRIVDFAKFGVRSASRPFIGRLNNDRVRGALRTSINSFLAQMVEDEMLTSYELAVSATRDQEIRGIVAVVMTLLPTFSIDFIKVTMFLQ